MKPDLRVVRGRLTPCVVVFAVALLVRLAVLLIGFSKVPPTADGQFYHVVAQRIAQGEGYTWLWPDGAVTYAAHYPVGYPLMMAGIYRIFGPLPQWVMVQNALTGALGVLASYEVCRAQLAHSFGPGRSARVSFFVALLFALSPSLAFYTPALMTEGEVAALCMVSVWLVQALRRRPRWFLYLLLAALLGSLVLLRPQMVLLVPLFAGLTIPKGQLTVRNLARAGLIALGSLCVVAPWTLRNCQKMERCVFVSANGGWNLLIGTFAEGQGAWVPIDGARVPQECREVFQEAAKDRCFGDAARRRILEHPGKWLSLAPKKLRATFDYASPASDHLGEAGALSGEALRWLRWSEYTWHRVVVALALLGAAYLAREAGRPRSLVIGVTVLGLVCCVFPTAWISWVLLLVLLLCATSALFEPAVGLAAASCFSTILVHAVFFGAGRYVLPAVLTLAPLSAYGIAYIGDLWPRRTSRRLAVDSAR